MGGRGHGMYMYNAAILNIFKLGLPVVVYTDEGEYDNLSKFIKEHNIENCHLELFDLKTVPFVDTVLKLKEKAGLIDENGLVKGISEIQNDRNHTLCLYKPFFVRDAIEKKFFESKNYFWIDAGLFHHGLFPNSLGGMEYAVRVDPDLYWPSFTNTLFKPGLIENMLKKTSDNFIFIKALQGYGLPGWWSQLSDMPFKGHIVGGLFGGTKETFIELIEHYQTILDRALTLEHLTLEEVLLSMCYAEKFNTYSAFEFETWYHDITTDRCGYPLGPDAKCFYKVFKVFD
jgi:hypothetical protein